MSNPTEQGELMALNVIFKASDEAGLRFGESEAAQKIGDDFAEAGYPSALLEAFIDSLSIPLCEGRPTLDDIIHAYESGHLQQVYGYGDQMPPLPLQDISRWRETDKEAVALHIDAGTLTWDEAIELYSSSIEELEQWVVKYAQPPRPAEFNLAV